MRIYVHTCIHTHTYIHTHTCTQNALKFTGMQIQINNFVIILFAVIC